MDRRSFLKTSALGGASAAAASTLAAPSYAQGKRTLTMVCAWPRGLAGVWDAVERFADAVNTMSDGQLIIDAKASGELVGGLEVFDAVTSGQADIYHAADYYFVGQHPALAYFTTVPFGMTAPEMQVLVLRDGRAVNCTATLAKSSACTPTSVVRPARRVAAGSVRKSRPWKISRG